MRLFWGAWQIQGGRDYQEDFYAVYYKNECVLSHNDSQTLVHEKALPKNNYLFVLADGMGGMGNGDLAASTVTESFTSYFVSHFTPGCNENALLAESLEFANGELTKLVKEDPSRRGMGCTIIAVLANADEGYMSWISVGDSPLWVLSGENITRINDIHSWGHQAPRIWEGQRQKKPDLTLDDILKMNSPELLVSAVNGDDLALVDDSNGRQPLNSGDVIIMASDGMEAISERNVLDTTRRNYKHKRLMEVGFTDVVDSLIKEVQAVNDPDQDNTSLIVFSALEKDAGKLNIASNTDMLSRSENAIEPSEFSIQQVMNVRNIVIVGVFSLLVILAAYYGYLSFFSGSDPDPDPTLDPKVGIVIPEDELKTRLELEKKEAQEKREREAQEQREKEEQEQREKEAQEKLDEEAQEKLDKEAQEKRDKEAQEQSERDAQVEREKEAQVEREKEAQEKREKEAQEKREKEAQEKREREAQEKRDREAQAKRDREAQEKRDREAQEKRDREAQAKRDREAQEKREREAAASQPKKHKVSFILENEDRETSGFPSIITLAYFRNITYDEKEQWFTTEMSEGDSNETVTYWAEKAVTQGEIELSFSTSYRRAGKTFGADNVKAEDIPYISRDTSIYIYIPRTPKPDIRIRCVPGCAKPGGQ